jgi:hypothetical protein
VFHRAVLGFLMDMSGDVTSDHVGDHVGEGRQ